VPIHAPKHLSTASKRLYRSLATEYELAAEPHALETLRIVCEALDQAERARAALAVHGTTYVDRFGQPHARPEVKELHDASIRAMRAMRELSLDGVVAAEPRIPRVNGARQ
jgi:phage terminase small subunit